MNLQQLEQIQSQMQTDYNTRLGAKQELDSQLKEAETNLAQAKDDIEKWELEKILTTEVAAHMRANTIGSIEDIVTAGLQTVFTEEEVRFKIDIKTVKDESYAYWLIVDESGEVAIEAIPEDSDGGGAWDVYGTALRNAFAKLFNCTGMMAYDENGKHLDLRQVKNFAYFIKEYAKQTGKQILYCTHHQAIANVSDKVYSVVKRKGISHVSEGVM